ncbi:hypothetical protein AUJ62_03900 [Candidatus Pacearchaeota archaeon CG1_02_32_21]|nr:MAG: hypothetical protein AUJ62_03900 [Candidatus Pacearchaeota archaeon CG1_02_32_21]
MSILKIFNKKDENSPPDVGQEDVEDSGKKKKKGVDLEEDVGSEDEDETSDETDDDSGEDVTEEEAEEPEPKRKKTGKIVKPLRERAEESIPEGAVNKGFSVESEKNKLEFQKISARLEALNALIGGYGERISMLSQQIGEVRAMNLANEKSVGKLGAGAAKAIDIVTSLKPEKLRIEYQKADAKIQQVDEKVESNKQFMDALMKELKDVRSKIGTFIGTEELLKLNDAIKKDLVETQQMAVRAKMHSDKVEQIFAEVRSSVAESQKLDAKVRNLDANYSDVQKELERIKLDFSSIVRKQDFDSLKKEVTSKIDLINQALIYIDKIKDENMRLSRLIETTLGIVEESKNDIADISMTLGSDNLRKASEFDSKIDSVLEVLDALADKISNLEKKASANQGKKDVKQSSVKDNLSKKTKEHLKKASKPAPVSSPVKKPEIKKSPISEKTKEINLEENKPKFGTTFRGKETFEEDKEKISGLINEARETTKSIKSIMPKKLNKKPEKEIPIKKLIKKLNTPIKQSKQHSPPIKVKQPNVKNNAGKNMKKKDREEVIKKKLPLPQKIIVSKPRKKDEEKIIKKKLRKAKKR